MLFALGLCCGALGLAAVSTAAVRTVDGIEAAGVDPQRPVSVVLVAADPNSRIERLVDRQTGHRGFSHVVVDCGVRDAEGRSFTRRWTRCGAASGTAAVVGGLASGCASPCLRPMGSTCAARWRRWSVRPTTSPQRSTRVVEASCARGW